MNNTETVGKTIIEFLKCYSFSDICFLTGDFIKSYFSEEDISQSEILFIVCRENLDALRYHIDECVRDTALSAWTHDFKDNQAWQMYTWKFTDEQFTVYLENKPVVIDGTFSLPKTNILIPRQYIPVLSEKYYPITKDIKVHSYKEFKNIAGGL